MLQSPKLAILQSLDAMDKVQMEEVLIYIKGILSQSGQKLDPKAFKKEAMKEIRQALRKSKKGLQLAAWFVQHYFLKVLLYLPDSLPLLNSYYR